MAHEEVEQVYELSPVQQAMLFHSVYAPGSGVYVVQLSLRLAGPLDTAAFERAWRYVLERHATLRTGFYWEDLEKPVQVVYREVDLAIARESWRGMDEAEQRARLERFLAEDRERGFELGEPPLMRLALIEMAPGVHHLVWSHHHLLSDGWSQGLLLRELFAAYAAFAAGREPSLARPRDFRDYIAWLQRQDLGEAEAFWRSALAGFSSPTFLAGGEGRETDFRDARRREVRLSGKTTSALRDTARLNRLTLNTLVQGAWALLLSRYTGARDVVFGATVSGRPTDLPGVESIVGPFINTLPARVEVDPGRPLAAWLADLQERQVEQRRFEHTPLVEAQRWGGMPAGVPLFDNILVFENYPLDGAGLPGLALSEVLVNELTNYPVNLIVFPGAELVLELRYDAGRLDEPAAARLLGHLSGLLEAMAGGLDRAVGSLPLLAEAERHQTVAEWNDTAADYVSGVTLHELIAAQAARTPDAIAASFEGESLTYAELERRAGLLAAHLIRLGVMPDGQVGVLLERSLEMIVGLLGVMKAGAAYVPLDPTYPAERLALLIESAGIEIVVTQSHLDSLLPFNGPQSTVLSPPTNAAGTAGVPPAIDFIGRQDAGGPSRDLSGVTLIRLKSDLSDAALVAREFIPGQAGAAFLRSAPPRSSSHAGAADAHLAYVIYTSGSTGRPKGVMIPHRGIVNRLLWMQATYRLTPEDRVLQKTPYNFDVSVWEFFWPLITGARLVFAKPEGHKDPAYLADLIAREGITTLHFVPSMLQAFLEAPGLEALSSLRLVMASGEALPPDLVRRFYTRIHGAALHNLYGPTEASVDVSYWACVPDAERVPIGRPIANIRLHVVDRDLQPQPVGVAGELLLGGVGLARGYLARPDLTAAAFVPDPFATQPGDCLYRTGDLARTLADGNVEYLGRIDFQVKIRGVRIELGEIEAVLGSHPAVRECVVVVREDTPGARLLAAYVAGAGLPSAAELRDFLAGKLPEAMVPAVFVPLDSLPLSPNGKVDRRALPAPERPQPVADAAGAQPADPIEELVAGIWAEVLGLDAVGRNDDFFALGGHSLLATQVASRVRGGLGVDVPLRRLFETRTLAAFAAHVRAALQEGTPEARPIAPRPRDGEGPELPLSFAQQRLWFLDQLDPGTPAYNLPVAVRLAGDLDAGVLERAFAEVARRHEALRTVFTAVDGDPFQEVVPELDPELPVRDLRDLPAAEREPRAWAFIAEESRRPFDLRRGPLMRLHLLRLADHDHLLLVTLHHIVADGWSIGLLVREIAALYEAFAAGRPSPLAALPVQYADFAHWQRDPAQSGVLEAQLAYWRRQLAGAPATLDLPTDYPRPAVHTLRGAFRSATFSADLSAALHELSRREGATPFMVLLAAWAVLLARHTRQEDLVIGTPVAGRNRREIEGLIGFFVNTLALRADLAGSPAFAELLGRVRQTALEAFAHQDLPFERLVEELVTERDLAHLPLVETVLAFQNMPTRSLEVPGLTLTPAPVDTGFAKFDLALTLQEGPAGLEVFLEHNADLFDSATAARLLARFETLLRGAVEDPETGIWDLPLLLDAERAQIAGWSGAAGEPAHETLHGRFEAQARRTPEAVAVTCEGAHLLYRDLDHRADRLARGLRQAGVGPESRVGLCLPRSLDLVTGILGILKAGGAYVPLDPTYPRERLAYMIEDAGIRAVVTHAELAPAFEGVPEVLTVPEVLETSGDSEPLASPVEGSHLAYVIYTSGSTGRPKGTLVTHGNAVRLFDAAQPAFGFGPEDVWTLFHSYAFDFSVWEIWGALLYGGRLVVVPQEVSRDPGLFHDLLAHEGVTVLNQTPSAFAQLQRADEEPVRAGALSALRWVIFGGEALDPAALDPWFVRHGDERPALVNMYGITETTVHVTLRRVRHADALGERRSLIGPPLPDLSLHVAEVLGDGLRPAPVGVPGELIVGGAGLARGYLGRPDLTAERFTPDRWSGRPGARLYRSGDLGRFLPGGELEYLGRIDHQVKIRGFRIELGEIQTALAAHPAVRECAVIDRQDAAGSPFLAAYVVPSPGAPSDPGELRGFLAGRLPEYMVPSAFVFLDALPLTPTGKLDRRALPAPDRGRREGSGEVVAPRTPTEEIVVEIWKEVLALDQVSVEDGFFDLGGHSLLATRALARVQHAFGVELTLRELFQNPSAAALSARIDERLHTPGTGVPEDELASLLDELDGLSDEEARARLEALQS